MPPVTRRQSRLGSVPPAALQEESVKTAEVGEVRKMEDSKMRDVEVGVAKVDSPNEVVDEGEEKHSMEKEIVDALHRSDNEDNGKCEIL